MRRKRTGKECLFHAEIKSNRMIRIILLALIVVLPILDARWLGTTSATTRISIAFSLLPRSTCATWDGWMAQRNFGGGKSPASRIYGAYLASTRVVMDSPAAPG